RHRRYPAGRSLAFRRNGRSPMTTRGEASARPQIPRRVAARPPLRARWFTSILAASPATRASSSLTELPCPTLISRSPFRAPDRQLQTPLVQLALAQSVDVMHGSPDLTLHTPDASDVVQTS